MMPFGIGKPLTDEQVLQLASYVLSKHGTQPAEPEAARGRCATSPARDSGAVR